MTWDRTRRAFRRKLLSSAASITALTDRDAAEAKYKPLPDKPKTEPRPTRAGVVPRSRGRLSRGHRL